MKPSRRTVSYEEVEEKIEDLFHSESYEQIEELCQSALEEGSDHTYELTWYAALAEAYAGKTAKALRRLRENQENHGFFYPLSPRHTLFQDPENPESFEHLLETNGKHLAAAARRASRRELFIPAEGKTSEEPAGETPGEKPLFLAFHGWGESMGFLQRRWRSPLLEERFNRLFPQSSQITDTKGYSWDDRQKAFREIRESLQAAAVDPEATFPLFAGGFAQGAAIALEAAAAGIIPADGLILLCPPGIEGIQGLAEQSAEEIRDTLRRWAGSPRRDRERRIWIITGEDDPALEDQKDLTQLLRDSHIPVQMTINRGTGHGFPENLDKQMDEALSYLLGEIDLA